MFEQVIVFVAVMALVSIGFIAGMCAVCCWLSRQRVNASTFDPIELHDPTVVGFSCAVPCPTPASSRESVAAHSPSDISV